MDRPKRVRTTYDYHDSGLRCAEWVANDELAMEFSVAFEGTSMVASVRFQGVRNREEVEERLRAIIPHLVGDREVDSDGIFVEDDGRYCIWTLHGELMIAARSVLE